MGNCNTDYCDIFDRHLFNSVESVLKTIILQGRYLVTNIGGAKKFWRLLRALIGVWRGLF